jgi:hypothetical protein
VKKDGHRAQISSEGQKVLFEIQAWLLFLEDYFILKITSLLTVTFIETPISVCSLMLSCSSKFG